jgi:hypothetical protein
VMKHVEEQWQAELEWVKGVREEELAKMEMLPSDPAKSDEW